MRSPLNFATTSFLLVLSVLLGAARPTVASEWDSVGLGFVYWAPDDLGPDVAPTRSLRTASNTQEHRKLQTLKVGDSNSGCSPQYYTIMEALENANSGDTIELCEGVFNESIRIPDTLTKLKIKGQGKGKSVIRSPPGADAVFSTGPGIKVEVEKVTLDGNNAMAPDADAVAGFVCVGCDAKVNEVEINNIASSNSNVPSIVFFARSIVPGAGKKVELTKSDLVGVNVIGILIDGPGMSGKVKENNVVASAPAMSSRTIGIQVSRQATAQLEKNSVSNFYSPNLNEPSTAISAVCPGQGTQLKSNTVDGNDLGFTLIDSKEVTVEDNDISDTVVGVSIEFQPLAPCPQPMMVEKNEVKKNTILNTQALGIRLASADSLANTFIFNNKVEDNDIIITNGIGVLVEAGNGNTFEENKIEQCQVIGIGIAAGAGSLFKDNVIAESGVYGIAIAGGEGNSVKKNKILQSGDSGIGIEGGMENTFENNEMKESDRNGIFLLGGENNKIMKNKIESSKEYGIRVNGGSGNKFAENTIKDSGIEDIRAEVFGNVFIDNE